MTRKFQEFNDVPTSKLKELIDEYVHNETYRQILVDHFLNGFTFESVAEKYGYSDAQIKNIVYKYGDKVLKRMTYDVF